MKKLAIIATVMALAFLVGGPVFAGDHGKETTMTGWISDSCCGAKNANAKGAGCTKSCIEGGAKAVLVVGEKTYTIKGDAKKYADHAGQEVTVTGTLDGDTVDIKKIEPLKKARLWSRSRGNRGARPKGSPPSFRAIVPRGGEERR